MKTDQLLSLLLICHVFPQHVKVDSREIETKRGKMTMRTQVAYFKRPKSMFPIEFKFTLPESQKDPYPAGVYFIDPDAFDSGSFDSIELSRFDFKLIPVPPELASTLPKWG